MRKFIIVALLLLATPVPAFADVNCKDGVCHCSGTDQCKVLEMSGSCNGPITCHAPPQPCDCVAKAKVSNSTIKLKQPLGKSQN